jgi:type I restriction enzyme S subunit
VIVVNDVIVPEGYKSTDVGVIPEDWEVKELSEIVESDRPISYGIVQTGKYIDNGVKCIRVVDIIDGRINEDDLIKTSEKISNSYKKTILKENDLVIALRGKIGELAVINKNLVGENLTRGVALIAAKSIYQSCFLYYYLSSSKNKSILEKNLNGSALKEISIGILRKIPVVLPPLPEQKAIARILSDVDELIRECDSLLAKKRDIKQGTMQQLLTGKKRLPGFSGEWEEKKLGDCLIKNPDYGINAPAVPYSDNLPVYIRITDISEDGKFLPETKVSVNHPQSSKYLLENNDIVLARTGASVGKSYLYNQKDGELVFAGFLIRVKADCKLLDSRYLKGFLETQQYWNWVTVMSMRSGQPGINGNEYAQLKIPIPPTLPEQKAIAEILSDMDAEIEALEQKRDKYKAIKQGMMQELLTGKTRIKGLAR